MSKKVWNKCKKCQENISEIQEENKKKWPTISQKMLQKNSKYRWGHVVKIWLKVNKKYPKDFPIRTLNYKNCLLKSFNFKNSFLLKCFNFKNTKISKVPFLKCFNFKKRKFQNFACFKPEVGTIYQGTF